MKLETDNEFIRGTVAGSISATVICVLLEVLEAIGLAKHCWLFMAGQAFMYFQHTPGQIALALLIHLFIGSFWGIIIAFLYSKIFTDRFALIKSSVIGAIIFFFHFGLFDKVLKYPPKLRGETMTLFMIFLSYLIYCLLVTVLLKKLPWKTTHRTTQ